MQDPTYPLYPVLAFVGFLLTVIPLPWHIQAWNSGTCAFMIWTALSCLTGFVNSIVWRATTRNFAPIWCDISTKIAVGVSAGIPAAMLCITRRLYKITSVRSVSVTPEDKRRMIIEDLAIAAGMPLLVMILHVVVQGHRFDILENIGCVPVIYNTLPAYFLVFMWPILLGAVSFVYSALTLRSFWRRRVQFNDLITSNHSMNISRYIRLMLLAISDMLLTTPFAIFSMYISNKGVTLAPWISWEDTHYDFGRVAQIPAFFWRGNINYRTSIELTRWLPVLCAFLFFALFGFASEATKHYRAAFWTVVGLVGIKPRANERPTDKGVLPRWVKPMKANTKPTISPPIYTPRLSPMSDRKQSLASISSSPSSFGPNYDPDLENFVIVENQRTNYILPSPTISPPTPTESEQPPKYPSSSLYRSASHTSLHVMSPSSDSTSSSSSASSASTITLKSSNYTLRSIPSLDRIYISDEIPAHARFSHNPFYPPTNAVTLGGRRSPSPAPPSLAVPFADVAVAPYTRPFTPPPERDTEEVYSEVGTGAWGGVKVTVKTESEMRD